MHRCWSLWVLFLLCLSLAATAAPVRLGAHFPAIASTADLERAKAAGVQRVRIRADWPRIQPTAQKWEFGWLDTLVAGAQTRRLDVVLTFGPAPAWTVKYLDRPGPAELARAKPDTAAYRTYVTTVARRYQGRVKYYQVWERPCGATLLAVARDTQAFFRTATQAIHTVNPALRVIIPEPGDADLGWVADYLAGAQGASRGDILLITPVRSTLDPTAFWWRLEVLQTRVLPRQGAPELWAEIPVESDTIRERLTLAAAALVQGIPEVAFTGGVSTPAPWQNELLTIGVRALSEVQGYAYRGWSPFGAQAFAGVFARGSETQVLAVAPYGGEVRMVPGAAPTGDDCAVPSQVAQVTPLSGGTRRVNVSSPTTLPFSPGAAVLSGVTVATRPGTPAVHPAPVSGDTVAWDPSGTAAAALRPLPNMPGGAYRLDNLNGQPALRTVRNVAPWIHFDVPDGFLYYNTARVPVEVQITVAGARNRQRTGFNLYYDAVGGMNNSPWQWIEVGPERTFTYTVRLNDAIFANREGYDFRINMGGSDEELRVVNVVVRKGR